MSVEDELLRLARERERRTEDALNATLLDPSALFRQVRHYLAVQADLRRLARSNEKAIRLETLRRGATSLVCDGAGFSSGSHLTFSLRMQSQPGGSKITEFRFHLRLPAARNVNMVRIELNDRSSHEPLRVPRCHFHVGDSQAHIPFPIMDPRLILLLVCEHLEPDIGMTTDPGGHARKARRKG